MDQETIEGLLVCLDEAIFNREKSYESLDASFKRANGHILGSEYDEYKRRKDDIEKRFETKVLDYQEKLNDLCKKVRKKQPALIELQEKHLNIGGRFPRRITLGKSHVQFENLDFYVPKMFEFPFKKPMYICDDEQMSLMHKVILRLMYALPINKQEYYVFDPMGLGRSIWKFNDLLPEGTVFPQKKVMTKPVELKEALKEVLEYMQSLYAGTFNLNTECEDWDTYNRWMFSQNRPKKMLPYKIFIFMDVPDGMDSECFEMFRKLLMHSEECGFLVLFSFNEVLLEAEDSKMKAQELLLKRCVENSVPLHKVLDKAISDVEYKKLQITNIGEKFPIDSELFVMLSYMRDELKKCSNSMFSFDEMLSDNILFAKNSSKELLIPCGYSTSGGTEVNISIGDRYPHYLVGGTTGSGKSNLLHNIIVSACWNYSPEELRVYLLDFKEGVEFSRYSSPILRHAELVATEADTEYGISVLDQLTKENARRYNLFKKSKCNDIKSFRIKNPTEVMPRILVVVDEFQVLFEGKDKDSTLEKLTTLAKQGRACGIHLLLATQSLKGIDFGNVATQFSGRIALKCSAEDSKILLGGTSAGNEEAAELEIPYGILNTSQGSKAGNIKYAIPEAKDEIIGKKIEQINIESDRNRIVTDTKVFEGQTFPAFPNEDSFAERESMCLTLGEVMTYSAKRLKVVFSSMPENNILICGHDSQMKQDFIDEVICSALGCDDCQEIVYIGEKRPSSEVSFARTNEIVYYSKLKDFIAEYKDCFFEKRRFIILDNVYMLKEIGFPPPYATSPMPEEGKIFKNFWEDANKHGNHFIAFYEGMNRVKAAGLPIADFKYRVGYSLNSDETNQILGNAFLGSKMQPKKRAFFVDNLVIESWFRPYEMKL